MQSKMKDANLYAASVDKRLQYMEIDTGSFSKVHTCLILK